MSLENFKVDPEQSRRYYERFECPASQTEVVLIKKKPNSAGEKSKGRSYQINLAEKACRLDVGASAMTDMLYR